MAFPEENCRFIIRMIGHDTLKCPYLYLTRSDSKYQTLFSRDIIEEDDYFRLVLSISPFIINDREGEEEEANNNDTVLPHTQLITAQGVGEILEELEINQGFVTFTIIGELSEEYMSKRRLRKSIGDSIDTILDTCTSLKTLRLNAVDLGERSSGNSRHLKTDQASSTIQTLKLVLCLFNPSTTFPPLFARLGSLKNFVLDSSVMEIVENAYCNYFDLTSKYFIRKLCLE